MSALKIIRKLLLTTDCAKWIRRSERTRGRTRDTRFPCLRANIHILRFTKEYSYSITALKMCPVLLSCAQNSISTHAQATSHRNYRGNLLRARMCISGSRDHISVQPGEYDAEYGLSNTGVIFIKHDISPPLASTAGHTLACAGRIAMNFATDRSSPTHERLFSSLTLYLEFTIPDRIPFLFPEESIELYLNRISGD